MKPSKNKKKCVNPYYRYQWLRLFFGFNEFFGFLGGGHQYFPENWTLQNPEDANGETESYRTKLNRNYTPVEETEYITDAFSREAVSFVERNKAKPFFLYLAYNAPHGPLQATEKYLNRFENIKNATKPKNPLDGVNLLPYLTHKTDKAPHDYLFWRIYGRSSYAVMNKDEKKMVILKDSSFLYDLKKEINEKTNIMDNEKAVTTDLNTARATWEKGMIPPVFWGLGQSEEYKKEKGVMIKN